MRRNGHILGALDLVILKTLDSAPNHGFGITLHIQDVSGGLLRVEEGSLYPALHRLETQKLVTGEWRQTQNARKARFYTLTAAGKQRLAEEAESWTAMSKGVHKVLRFA
jgi:PadR family transcriptional regulator PadR